VLNEDYTYLTQELSVRFMSMDGTTRLALLQILEDRYGKKSVIITSQLPINKWHEYIGESTIADAIMDRLAVNAHRIDLKGESLRKKK
jgi:DNA replication protein DnaC